MWSLCWRWRIPKKTDDAGWRELATKVAADAPARVFHDTTLTKNLEELTAQVQEASKIRDPAKRDRKLRALQERILRFEQARSILRSEQSQAQQVGAQNP
jgi:hypothetical protein